MMDHSATSISSPDDPITSEVAGLLTGLRRALKSAGWTQARLAAELGVGTATIKRWLHGRGLTLQTLQRLTGLAGISLGELVDGSRMIAQDETHLTLAQEEALTQDVNLSTIFFLIVNGWPLSEATEGFHIPPDVVERHVSRLERLALIDRLPGGRARAKLSPSHAWQRAPMRRHFERHLKQLFVNINYGDPETIFGAETVKLSPLGVAKMRESIEAFRAELRAIEIEDRRTAALPAEWHGVLAVATSLKASIGP